jgi:hypothetical protein
MGAPRLATTNASGARTYPWPPDDPTTEAPSVTTVLRSLAKPALVPWAAKVTAEQAVAMTKTGALAALVKQDEAAAVAAVKDAPRNQRDSAGTFGVSVHEALEAWATGGSLPMLDGPGAEAWGHLSALLDAYEVEPLYAEVTVYGDTDDPATVYAGTCDLVADVTIPSRGRTRLVLDCKTNRGGVYPEAAFQLAAYRHASHLVTDSGDVVPMPGVSGGLVLAARPERAQAVPVDTGPEAVAMFRHLRAVHHLTTNGPRYVRRPLPPKGAAA